MATLTELTDAVYNYYGAQSDEYYAISTNGVDADNFNDIVAALPGWHVIYDDDSEVMGYTRDDVIPTATTAETEAAAINSNVQTGIKNGLSAATPLSLAYVDGAATATTEAVKTSDGNPAKAIAVGIGAVLAFGAAANALGVQLDPTAMDDDFKQSLAEDIGEDDANALLAFTQGTDVLDALYYLPKKFIDAVGNILEKLGVWGTTETSGVWFAATNQPEIPDYNPATNIGTSATITFSTSAGTTTATDSFSSDSDMVAYVTSPDEYSSSKLLYVYSASTISSSSGTSGTFTGTDGATYYSMTIRHSFGRYQSKEDIDIAELPDNYAAVSAQYSLNGVTGFPNSTITGLTDGTNSLGSIGEDAYIGFILASADPISIHLTSTAPMYAYAVHTGPSANSYLYVYSTSEISSSSGTSSSIELGGTTYYRFSTTTSMAGTHIAYPAMPAYSDSLSDDDIAALLSMDPADISTGTSTRAGVPNGVSFKGNTPSDSQVSGHQYGEFASANVSGHQITQNYKAKDGTVGTTEYIPVSVSRKTSTETVGGTALPLPITTGTEVIPNTETPSITITDSPATETDAEQQLGITEALTGVATGVTTAAETAAGIVAQIGTMLATAIETALGALGNLGLGTTPTVSKQTGSGGVMWTAYNPTQSELDSFGAWLWSSEVFENIKKLFDNPMNSIISLMKIYAEPSSSSRGDIVVGYTDSGVTCDIIDEQFVDVDCGSVAIQEYFGNVFDYAPYTSIKLYLPFIGVVELDPAEVMRGTVGITYHVDSYTGTCLADVSVTRDGYSPVLYQYGGTAGFICPYTSGSFLGGILGIGALVGGIGAAIAGVATGGAALISGGLGAAKAGMANANTNIVHSAGFTGVAGAMGSKTPYIIISRPQPVMAKNYRNYIGGGAYYTTKLSACSGFIKCMDVHLENITATGNEKTEIERLLKEGVLV